MPGAGICDTLAGGGSLLKHSYQLSLNLIFSLAALLSFLTAAVFVFPWVFGLSDQLVASSKDPAQAEFLRMVARSRSIEAISKAILFLLAQAAIQIFALVLSSRIATRGLKAEFRRMSDTIGEQERRLEEAAALMGWKEVASFLSHQLKNPLAAIDLAQGNIHSALSRLGPAQGQEAQALQVLRDGAGVIAAEGLRMRNLINRLKSLTAFQEPSFAECQLSALWREAVERTNGQLSLHMQGEGLIRGDRELLRQAFINLADNSLEEAQKAGRTHAELYVRIERREQEWEITVEDDNGDLAVGLEHRLGRERYTDKRTGSGLGLLFVSRIMALHSGSFRAERGAANGLSLRLRLPRTEGGRS